MLQCARLFRPDLGGLDRATNPAYRTSTRKDRVRTAVQVDSARKNNNRRISRLWLDLLPMGVARNRDHGRRARVPDAAPRHAVAQSSLALARCTGRIKCVHPGLLAGMRVRPEGCRRRDCAAFSVPGLRSLDRTSRPALQASEDWKPCRGRRWGHCGGGRRRGLCRNCAAEQTSSREARPHDGRKHKLVPAKRRTTINAEQIASAAGRTRRFGDPDRSHRAFSHGAGNLCRQRKQRGGSASRGRPPRGG